ncbi:MAG TPA: PKD domain-containing protein, partial [Gemmatimonadaceae bacterium]|nr:PKD domain-containing protein [Gemmatimonadaceae bacterium]
PNRLLRVNGTGETVTPLPAPAPAPAPEPAPNAAPSASFDYSCQKGNCKFDASASRDDNGISSYVWTFGDGTSSVTSTSPYTSHVYTRKGNYTVYVSLTVSDAAGLKSTTEHSINIKNKGR